MPWIRTGAHHDHACDEPPVVIRTDDGYDVVAATRQLIDHGAIWACGERCRSGLLCPEMWLFQGYDEFNTPMWTRWAEW